MGKIQYAPAEIAGSLRAYVRPRCHTRVNSTAFNFASLAPAVSIAIVRDRVFRPSINFNSPFYITEFISRQCINGATVWTRDEVYYARCAAGRNFRESVIAGARLGAISLSGNFYFAAIHRGAQLRVSSDLRDSHMQRFQRRRLLIFRGAGRRVTHALCVHFTTRTDTRDCRAAEEWKEEKTEVNREIEKKTSR